jgi:cell division protein FtsL
MESYFGLIEIVLVFAIAIALIGYDLWSVRREIASDRAKAAEGEPRERSEE